MQILRKGDRIDVMEILENIKQAVIDMEVEKTADLTGKALKNGIDPEDLLNKGLAPAMDIVGEQYEKGARYIPEMLASAEAMKGAMELLKPLLTKAEVKSAGKVVIGTVEGDLHDIGQQLVSMMLEGASFEVHNLGSEVPAERFVDVLNEERPDIVGMSALLTTTMLRMPEVIKALKEAGIRDQVKVMIGGAPVTQEFAKEIGADGYGEDAAAAMKLAKSFMKREI